MYLADAGSAAAGGIIGLLVIVAWVVGTVIYFIPTFIAFRRNKSNKIAILALNFFLGWSLVGWVVSLVWALSNEAPANLSQVVVHHTYEPPVPAAPSAPKEPS